MSHARVETDGDDTVYAAGVLLWHRAEDGIRVLVIHRDRHDDYSLAKGKVDPGESLPQTAAREVLEETGFEVALGAPLTPIEYDLPDGRGKVVHYWSAEVDAEAVRDHAFAPNDEVDAIEWLPLTEARERLTYDRDRDVVDEFAERCDAGAARTFAIIALRHAKAVPAHAWPGGDETRPLTGRGQEQADLVVPLIAAFGPTRVVTSTAARCMATVAPLATATGLLPETSAAISQAAYDDGDDDTAAVIAATVEARATTVLCSHSPVIPEIVRAVALATGTPTRDVLRHSMLSTAEFVVLHLSADDPANGVVATEMHGPIV